MLRDLVPEPKGPGYALERPPAWPDAEQSPLFRPNRAPACGCGIGAFPTLCRRPFASNTAAVAATWLCSITYAIMNATGGIFDTSAACVERLGQLRETFGTGRVICWFNFGGLVPHARGLESMELFAAEVPPHF